MNCPVGCWKLNASPLEKQYTLLTMESSVELHENLHFNRQSSAAAAVGVTSCLQNHQHKQVKHLENERTSLSSFGLSGLKEQVLVTRNIPARWRLLAGSSSCSLLQLQREVGFTFGWCPVLSECFVTISETGIKMLK